MTDETVAVEQCDPEFATIEAWEHDDQRELSLLYNHRHDDSLQFNRGQMRVAIRHGRRLAALKDAKVHVPGVLCCAKCSFRLIKTTLNVGDGNAYANEEPDRCPNCDVPMWRVSWEDEAREAYRVAESQMNRALEAERRLAALTTGPSLATDSDVAAVALLAGVHEDMNKAIGLVPYSVAALAVRDALARPRAAVEPWRPIGEFAGRGEAESVIVAVICPGREPVVGEAYFDPEAYDGTWWWAGTSRREYFDNPIEEINHGRVAFFQPLPSFTALQSQSGEITNR